jgi:hypothetical protein
MLAMGYTHSFKFLDDDLNHRLIALMKKARVNHVVDKTGIIHYSPDDDEVVENDLICSIRRQVFTSWQILTCPNDWIGTYKRYMSKHRIPFSEELSNNQLWFLIPRKYRPYAWKLEPQASEQVARLAR